jgi:D-aminopeptidase
MTGPPAPRPRLRSYGLAVGLLPTGPTNSIVDVPHVRVGHATVWRDEPPPPAGRGVARTGVTAIVPFDAGGLFRAPVPAGCAVLNGAGEVIGLTSIREWGILETPIFLTSSMAIGRVYDAAVAALLDADPAMGVDDAVMPVVGECDDGFLNQSRSPQVDETDVQRALDSAAGHEAGPCAEGVAGAGTGMICHGLKGGIGSASRVVCPVDIREERTQAGNHDGPAFTVGVLALTNYGLLERLTIAGAPVGATLARERWGGAVADADAVPVTAGGGHRPQGSDPGSCIVVVATDAPLTGHQLGRMARRAALGLARTGSFGGHGSGEIFLAFSTGLRLRRGSGAALRTETVVNDEYLGPFFAAVVEATEEAACNSLFVADEVRGRDGHVARALPVERVLALAGRGNGG